MMDIKEGWPLWFIDHGVTLSNKSILQNEQLAEELYKPIIRKFKKGSIFSIQRQYLGCRFSRYAINK